MTTPVSRRLEPPWRVAGAMLPWKGSDDPELWQRQLSALAGAGFTDVDITDSWLKPGEMNAEQLRQLAVCIRSADLDVVALSLIRRSVIDPRDGEANLAYSHRSLDAAAKLGAGVVSVGLHRPLTPAQRDRLWFWTVPGPVDDRSDESFELAAHRLRELAQHAGDLGLQLSLEMYEDTLLGDADSACRLLELIDADNVGLNPDIGNLVRKQGPIDDVAALLAKVLPVSNYWHVKNYLRLEDPASGSVLTTPSSMRAGVINYRVAFELALSVGFRGALCIEQYGGDMLGVMKENREYCLELMEGLVAG